MFIDWSASISKKPIFRDSRLYYPACVYHFSPVHTYTPGFLDG
jgi:hypothetical protein